MLPLVFVYCTLLFVFAGVVLQLLGFWCSWCVVGCVFFAVLGCCRLPFAVGIAVVCWCLLFVATSRCVLLVAVNGVVCCG